jgi:hypothetical protein
VFKLVDDDNKSLLKGDNILYTIGQLTRFILKPAVIYLQIYKQLL